MTISQAGVDFICQFEGFRANPYRDSTGLPTIGYGTIHYANGAAVTMSDGPISQADAKAALMNHIANRVDPYLNTIATLTQVQYDALCSFCYNLGTGALDKSSLRHVLFSNDPATITADFDKWDMAGGQVLNGLLNRRQHEARLYTTGQYS